MQPLPSKPPTLEQFGTMLKQPLFNPWAFIWLWFTTIYVTDGAEWIRLMGLLDGNSGRGCDFNEDCGGGGRTHYTGYHA